MNLFTIRTVNVLVEERANEGGLPRDARAVQHADKVMLPIFLHNPRPAAISRLHPTALRDVQMRAIAFKLQLLRRVVKTPHRSHCQHSHRFVPRLHYMWVDRNWREGSDSRSEVTNRNVDVCAIGTNAVRYTALNMWFATVEIDLDFHLLVLQNALRAVLCSDDPLRCDERRRAVAHLFAHRDVCVVKASPCRDELEGETDAWGRRGRRRCKRPELAARAVSRRRGAAALQRAERRRGGCAVPLERPTRAFLIVKARRAARRCCVACE